VSEESRDLIERAARGDREAVDALLPQLYEELRAQAARVMQRTDWNSTLAPTMLVHEAYLRLAERPPADWNGRTHFFALAARVMRQVLVDHARARGAAKRGGGWERVTLSFAQPAGAAATFDALELDEALAGLSGEDERQARIVELRFYAGLTVPEVAALLDVSVPTVEREWRHARAWLRRKLSEETP
jgi:RNA polymerase sigma factor (TIGR02999 family)